MPCILQQSEHSLEAEREVYERRGAFSRRFESVRAIGRGRAARLRHGSVRVQTRDGQAPTG